jgi:hypothetical protein
MRRAYVLGSGFVFAAVFKRLMFILLSMGAMAQAFAQSSTMTSPANGATYSAPATITLTASVIPPSGGTIGSTNFYANGSLVGTVTGGSSNPTLTLSSVAAGTYSYTASTVSHAASGGATNIASNAVSVTVRSIAAQTITFGALAGKTYGAGAFTVSASASSGLAVSFSSNSTSVCTVSGTTVSIVGAGTCSISANQAGNGSYSAAPTVTQTFAVAQATQSITFPAPSSKVAGSGAFNLGASASSGLAVSTVSNSTAVCTVSGASATPIAAGTCSITASQAGNANYLAATANTETFSVSAALVAQTITFPTIPAKTYGAAPFVINPPPSAGSGLAVSVTSNSPSICSVSGLTVTLLTGGSCSLSANQGGNGTYSPAPQVNQSFNIAPATQTITFPTVASRTAGSGAFNPGATASSGLAVSYTSNSTSICTASGSSVTPVAVGTCSVTASQAGSTSYSAAASVPQTFSVTAPLSSQTISFAPPPSQVYGTAPYGLAATATSGLPVSFGSSTPAVCTVSGSTVTLVATGTCTIVASQAGNASYAAAPNVTQAFSVVSAANPVIAVGASNTSTGVSGTTYGAPANITLTANIAAPVGATVGIVTFYANGTSVGTASPNGTSATLALSSVPAGAYSYSAMVVTHAVNGTATNYTSTALNVGVYNMVPQTITFNSLSSVPANTAPFAISASTTSGLPITFSSSPTAPRPARPAAR